MDVVVNEHANLRAALGSMISQGELEQGVALCLELGGFWLGHGHLNEGHEWLARFLEHEG